MVLEYLEPTSSPLGKSSKITLNGKSDWFVQTPKGVICSIDKDKLEIEFETLDNNYKGFQGFMKSIGIKNREWKNKINQTSKHKEKNQKLTLFECIITKDTEYYNSDKCIHDNKLIPGQCVILVITTPCVWISKKNFGNTWEIKQLMKV